jgi:hypothetical protein
VLLRHHLEVAFRLPSESTTGKDLFPGAHNVVDVLFWRARGGELRQVDPGDGFILEGDYFKENPAHILGTEHGEDDEATARSAAATPSSATSPASPRSPRGRSARAAPSPTSRPSRSRPVTTVTRDLDDEPGDARVDLRQALDLGRRVDRYLALVAAEDPRAIGLWPELSEALRNLKHAPALRPTTATRGAGPSCARWPSAARSRSACCPPTRRPASSPRRSPRPPNIQPKFRAQPGDVLAQAEHLHRSRRHLTIAELEAFHRAGRLLDRADMLRQLLAAEWNLDGDAGTSWSPRAPTSAACCGPSTTARPPAPTPTRRPPCRCAASRAR